MVVENNLKNEEIVNRENDARLPSKKFSIEILRVIKEAQQQHGLRHGDYQRYRSYCSRRIRRLRKAAKLPQGDKRHFKKRDVTISNLTSKYIDERLLQIPLILAERCWSYGMQLRQEANTEPRKRFHMINKLRKACFYALQLQELSNADIFDARTRLEVEAYVSWIHASLHFELSLWKTAAENFKKAQVVYENLANALTEEEQVLYRTKVDELVPNLRYCAYNIGEGGSLDELLEMRARGLVENLNALVTQTKVQNSETKLQTIDWRGKKITVRSEKVRLFLLSEHELDKSLVKAKNIESKIELLENMLMDCKDVISAIKDELRNDPKIKSSATGQSSSGMQNLLAYLSYIRLFRTIERNLCLVEQTQINLEDPNKKGKTFEGKRVKARDLTRLYEIILQNVSELQQINGMESDDVFQKEIAILNTSFKAFRCYYIALTLVELKRWKEAVAMYERSLNYAIEALKNEPKPFELQTELAKLISNIEGCKFSAHAYSVLECDSIDDLFVYSRKDKTNKPLYERLHEYREDQQLNTKNPNVFKLTPEMQPIPCKPLFYDLAQNFLTFPSLEDKLDNAGNKKGISGFVKGFLGWGGSK